MSGRTRTRPYYANAFTNNPPTGGMTTFLTDQFFTGFIASSGSFGVTVRAFESAGKAYIQLYRMYGAVAQLTLTYHTTDGTAVSGVDYTGQSGTVVWSAFDISAKVVTIPILRTSSTSNSQFNFVIDGVKIGNSLFSSVYVFVGGNIVPFPGPNFTTLGTSFPVVIQREGRGEVDFPISPTYQVTRPGGTTTVQLTVFREVGFKGAVGCSWHTVDGTAHAGTDYTAGSGTLSWTDGDGAGKTITVTILNGGAGTTQFTVVIDTPTGGVAIGAINIATVQIIPGAPAAPPTGASIPNQLYDNLLVNADSPNGGSGGFAFQFRNDFFAELVETWFANNILYNSILNNKIGSFIGITGGTGSFGGGTDPVNQDPTFVPPTRFQKFMGHEY